MKRPAPYHPTLFDTYPLKKEAVVLDIKQGRVERDAGIKKAVDHANEVEPGWTDKAYTLLLNFLSNHIGPFMAEDVRSYAALVDFPLPPHARAWGGVIVRAKYAGLIDQCGTKKVRNKKAHCANAAVWRQIKPNQ